MNLPRPQFTVRWMMIAGAIVGTFFGVNRYKTVMDARAKMARLKADLARAEHRLAWSEAMLGKNSCYAPAAQAQALLRKDRAALDQIKQKVRQFDGR